MPKFPASVNIYGVDVKLMPVPVSYNSLCKALIRSGYVGSATNMICGSQIDLARGTTANNVLEKAFNKTSASVLTSQVNGLVNQIKLANSQDTLLIFEYSGSDLVNAQSGEVRATDGQMFVLSTTVTKMAENVNFQPITQNDFDTRSNEEREYDAAEASMKSTFELTV